MTSEAERQRARDFIDAQRRVLAELKEALTADPVTRLRWERIRIDHGDWRCRTVGAPQPHGLSATMVRTEVGLLSPGAGFDELKAARIDRKPLYATLTFDYPEGELDLIPQRVTEGVRAYIEKESA